MGSFHRNSRTPVEVATGGRGRFVEDAEKDVGEIDCAP